MFIIIFGTLIGIGELIEKGQYGWAFAFAVLGAAFLVCMRLTGHAVDLDD
jgi:hypothetical protein